jgi:MATE family multidrug resistance protein
MFINRRSVAESKRIIYLGLPIIIGQVLQMSMGFVDTVMAGNLSPEDLAAVAIGSSFMTPVFVFSMGLLMAMNSIISQNLGSGKILEIGRNFRQAVYLSQIMAWISFFVVRNLEWMMVYLGIEQQVVDLAQGYIEAMSWGLPAITLYMVFRFFNEGISITRPTMYFAFVGLLFNILGNYTLMFGNFGFPALGAVGTGWASSIVAFAMLIGIAIYTLTRKAYEKYQLLSDFRKPDFEYMKEIITIGTPIGISTFMEVSMFATVALLMGKMGTAIVAGHQIAINITALIFMIPLGLSNAITVRVGQARGRGDWEGVKRSGFAGIGITVGIMLVTATMLITIPEFLVGIYTDDSNVQSIAVSLLAMAAIFQISDGLQVSGAGALRGLKDTKIPMIVNFTAYWLIGIPAGYAFGLWLDYGPQGLWVGLICGLTVAAILHNARFVWFLKKHAQ